MADVREILGENSTIGGYGCFAPASQAINIGRFGSWIIALIIFLGVSMLVTVMQYFSVVERKTEMGILKAIGWSSKNIRHQIILESVIHSIAGGVPGVAIAILILKYDPVSVFINAVPEETAVMHAWIPVAGLAVAVLAGVTAGFFSSLFTIRFRPAEILRKL